MSLPSNNNSTTLEDRRKLMNDIKLGIMVVLIVQFISVIGVIYLIGQVC